MGKKAVRSLFLILPFLVMTISCKKDSLDEVEIANQDILEARMWFETTHSPNLIIDSKKSARKKAISVPNWDFAKAFTHKKSKTIEVPLISDGEFGFASNESYLAFQATGEKRYLESRTHLVIESENGKKRGFLMTIIPDKSFKLRKDFEAFGSTYRKWENDFSGSVLYHKLDGTYSNGWKITEGRSSNRILHDGENGIPTIVSKGCWAAYLVSWEYTCEQTDKGNTISLNDFAQTSGCKYTEEWEYLYTICDDGEGGGGGGGSGDGEYESDTQNIDPIYDASSTLDPNQKLLLEATVIAFIEMNPVYSYIWQQLLNNNVCIKFSINPNLAASAAFYPSTNEIVFRQESFINITHLAEELIHVAQKLTYGANMKDEIRNFELEAKLLQDVVCRKYGAYTCTFWAESGFQNQNAIDAYNIWMWYLIDGGSMDVDTFNQFCQVWYYPNPPENYNDPTFIPQLYLNLLSGGTSGPTDPGDQNMY